MQDQKRRKMLTQASKQPSIGANKEATGEKENTDEQTGGQAAKYQRAIAEQTEGVSRAEQNDKKRRSKRMSKVRRVRSKQRSRCRSK